MLNLCWVKRNVLIHLAFKFGELKFNDISNAGLCFGLLLLAGLLQGNKKGK